MYLIIEENPNCPPEERVFAASGPQRKVKRVEVTPPSQMNAVWCDVAAVDENGAFDVPTAQRVEDSADGTAWLVSGGAWGLRLKISGAWSMSADDQWGVPFLVLDSSGNGIEFQ